MYRAQKGGSNKDAIRVDSALFLLAAFVAMLTLSGGCSPEAKDPADMSDETARPDEPADLIGTVVSVERPGQAAPSASSSPSPARVLVEGEPSSEPTTSEGSATKGGIERPAKGERYLLNLKITPDTRILARESEAGLSEASTSDLEPDQSVEIWHSSEVGRSYPGQAYANTIVIL